MTTTLLDIRENTDSYKKCNNCKAINYKTNTNCFSCHKLKFSALPSKDIWTIYDNYLKKGFSRREVDDFELTC